MEKRTIMASSWKGHQKIAFRFAFIFFILFIVFLDWSVNPLLSKLYYYGPLSTILDGIIPWIGKELFDIPYLIVSPYDGQHHDRTYVYLLYFTMAVVAAIGAAVWSLLDRKRPNYQVLYYWLTVLVRYYLAFTMFLFALEKFFKMQFPDLGYYTLTERVGDMSPMHLAWAFFGYSYTYNIFMGIAESAALLLLFRRTTTLGALLTLITLSNVIAVNFSYDVHAKMYPTALGIMALFLLLRDGHRIIQFFLTGKAVSLPVIKAPVFQKKWMTISKIGLKTLVIGYFLIFLVNDYIDYRSRSEARQDAKSSYAGLYDVTWFVVNKDTLAQDDPSRWNQLILGDRVLEAVRFQADSTAYISVLADKNQIIVYGDRNDLAVKTQEIYNEKGLSDETWMNMDATLVARQIASSFQFKLTDSNTLMLNGMIKNDSVLITAKRKHINIEEFRLMRRRFHWINEVDYFY
nr:hypothetical protein [Allomuricauda sp.]